MHIRAGSIPAPPAIFKGKLMSAQLKFAFNELLISNVWDKRFDLPTVASAANPHIYCAYVVRILESFESGSSKTNASGAKTIRLQYAEEFLPKCEEYGKPGLIRTFPDTGSASHDDAHGAGFLNREFAQRCIYYLAQHDGSYTDQVDAEAKNIYRFLFMMPALRAHAGFRVGVVSQIQFIIALLAQLWFSEAGSTDGHLLLWLAFPAMRQSRVVSAVIDYWCDTWTRRGYTPRSIFRTKYLTESPWFGEWARDDWN